MSFLSSIGSVFGFIGSAIVHALGYANSKGLTDAVVDSAKALAKQAAETTLDNAGKREYVVAALVGLGLPESIARLATELGVQALKAELAKVP